MQQKIVANGVELFVDTIIGRKDMIDGTMYELLELHTKEPLSAKAIEALRNDPEWTLYDYDGTPFVKENFTALLSCRYWLGQVDTNTIVIREKEAQLAQVTAALEQKEQEVHVVATTLLRGASRERALPLRTYIPEWAPEPFEEGDIRQENGQVYQLVGGKAHDATPHPDWNPSAQPSLWFLWHGYSRETALPFVPVTGAHDMYKKGEWMILNDEYYEALEDTAYSPIDYARAWRKDSWTKLTHST